MSRLPVPDVPAAAGGAMRLFLLAVRDKLSVLIGSSQDVMSRSVTFNDLVAMGLVEEGAAGAQARSVKE